MIEISFVISTKNRVQNLQLCLNSILEFMIGDYEILVIDQSYDKLTKKLVFGLNKNSVKKRIRYYHTLIKGLSNSRNLGIAKAKGKFLAFLDDDCFLTLNYKTAIQQIYSQQKKNERYGIFFGQTISYKPLDHRGLFCPNTFQGRSIKPRISLKTPWKLIGNGNNMVIPAKIFKKIGNFKTWLGLGSIGESGEDVEFALRCLSAGYQISYSQNLLVYHDKWLTKEQLILQGRKYRCGGVAAYAFYFLRKIKDCKTSLVFYRKQMFQQILAELYLLTHRKKKLFLIIKTIFEEIYYFIKGWVLAIYYNSF